MTPRLMIRILNESGGQTKISNLIVNLLSRAGYAGAISLSAMDLETFCEDVDERIAAYRAKRYEVQVACRRGVNEGFAEFLSGVTKIDPDSN